MKKTLSLALSLFTAAFLFSSCDDLTTIEIPFNLQTTHMLAVDGVNANISQTVDVDLTTNADFNKHKASIKDAGIDSIQVRITDHTGSATQTITGSVTAANLGGLNPTELYAVNAMNLSQWQTQSAGEVWITIQITQEGRDKLAGLIKNSPHSATLALTGVANETPVHFTAHFKIWWAMKATEELI